MCSLFGLIDYSNALPAAARKVIIRELSRECEIRGTDATGISYNSFGKLKIFKRPVRASKLNIRVPFDSKVVMGHTRMTTKGNQKININNHPFPGHVEGVDFALAHNGVLQNDELLRKSMKLPDTNIETDSYIAVQLIENSGSLDFESVKAMAEAVQGTFCFTILNDRNELYLVKGNNPLEMCDCGGYYLYASTDSILKQIMKRFKIKKAGRVNLEEGTITKVYPDGRLEAMKFDIFDEFDYDHYFGGYSKWDFFGDEIEPPDEERIDYLVEYASYFGIDEGDIRLLVEAGYDEFDIEEMLYDPMTMQQALSGFKEYSVCERG